MTLMDIGLHKNCGGMLLYSTDLRLVECNKCMRRKKVDWGEKIAEFDLPIPTILDKDFMEGEKAIREYWNTSLNNDRRY